jgi:hypothetical protein
VDFEGGDLTKLAIIRVEDTRVDLGRAGRQLLRKYHFDSISKIGKIPPLLETDSSATIRGGDGAAGKFGCNDQAGGFCPGD